MEIVIYILLSIVMLVSGLIIGIILKEKNLRVHEKNSKSIIDKAESTAKETKKEMITEAKNEIISLKKEYNTELKEKKQEIKQFENKILQREKFIDKRIDSLDSRESNLNSKEERINDLKNDLKEEKEKVNELIVEQEKKLISISTLSKEEAQKILFKNLEVTLANEMTAFIMEEEEKAKLVANKKAKEFITLAIQKYSNEVTASKTVSVVQIPNDEMKGRIIGREGRNIRTIEALTGVDLIIDDTPEAVVLSCFDPVRREVARITLESLVNDGRIHPAKIEEAVDAANKEIEDIIIEKGQDALFQTGVGRVHPEIIKMLGKLHYRTSYGQNVLKHSIESAMLAGKMAVEIGEDEILARRAGLLHDIGKSIDHEIEGSHVEIGMKFAEKYGENETVVNAIASHHGDYPPTSFISILVEAADTLSAGRPGARNQSTEDYIERLQKLERISNAIEGVDQAYAISAGREIRVMVSPDKIDDLGIHRISKKLKEEIETNLTYPGTVKVTVIREQRSIDVAK